VWRWWPRGTMPSRRAAAIGISATLIAGLLVLAVTGAGKRTDLVQSDAVNPIYPVAPVAPGGVVCQKPFGLTETLDRVRFNAGTFGRPGPPLVVSVTSEQSGAELGWGRQPPGWVDNGTPRIIDVGAVTPGEQVDVCIRNEGRTPAYLYGDCYHGRFLKGPLGVTPTNSTSSAYVDGVMVEGDVAMSLYGPDEHSALARIPSIIRHAATFKMPFVGPWLF